MNPQDPHSLYGLTGSRMAQQKPHTPRGLYIIAGINVLGFIATFFDTSQTSLIYTLAMLLSLLTAVGLLFRLEAARKTLIVLSVITIVLAIVSAFLLAGLQGRIAASHQRYDRAISNIDTKALTAAEQRQLNTIQTELTDAENKAGKAITYTYSISAFYILESAGVIVYLTRPSIKTIFAV